MRDSRLRRARYIRCYAAGRLTNEWREEDKRKKRFYKLSSQGGGVLENLLVDWNGINEALHKF
jgi:PadR family transcriptional regulator PadR